MPLRYTGSTLRRCCLSPSSRFALERCSFHPSPAGASRRASRNTSFKLCNFVNGARTHTHTLVHQSQSYYETCAENRWFLDIGVQGGIKNKIMHVLLSEGPSRIVVYEEEAEPKASLRTRSSWDKSGVLNVLIGRFCIHP